MPRVDQIKILFSLIAKCAELENGINEARLKLRYKDTLSYEFLDQSEESVAAFRKAVLKELNYLMK